MTRKKEEVISISSRNLFEAIDQFLAAQDVTRGSKIMYRNALKQFFAWFLEQKITNPTRETILAYKEDLDLKGLRPSTRAGYLVAVRKFFEWAEGLKLYPNIAKGIKGARRALKHHQKDSLTVPQIKKLLGTIDQNISQGKRDFALLNVLIRTGCRLIEVVRADYNDLDLQGDEALLWIRVKGRDGKDDFVVLPEETLAPLLNYLRSKTIKKPEDPLFTSLSDRNKGKRLTTFSLSRIVKGYLRKAGLDSKRITAHSLRHTFGVLSIKAGASLYEVQLAMRHSNPGTTEIYLGDIEKQKRLEGGPEKRLNALLANEET